MADTGQPWVLPYSLLTDPPNGPQAVQDLATKTAAGLGRAYPCTSTTRPAHVAGLIIEESDTNLLYYSDGANWLPLAVGDDTGWQDIITAGFAAAANMSLVSGQCRRRYGVVSLYASLTTTAGFSSGDVGNTTVLTAPAGWYPATTVGGLNGGASGGLLSFYINASGSIVLTATGSAYGAGATFNVTGTYLL